MNFPNYYFIISPHYCILSNPDQLFIYLDCCYFKYPDSSSTNYFITINNHDLTNSHDIVKH